MRHNMSVIKLGGRDVYSAEGVYDDIKKLSENGEKIVMVTGGSYAIKKRFEEEGTEQIYITMANGDQVRFCGLNQMPTIERAYRSDVFPHVYNRLTNRGLNSLCFCGSDGGLIVGKRYPPLKVKHGDGYRVERNSLVGKVCAVKHDILHNLLNAVDVVVISPPIVTNEGEMINVDADMLAAHIAVEMNSAYLHFLTSSNGILKDVNDPRSTVQNFYSVDKIEDTYVKGPMKQKLRAARYAAENGKSYITISSSRRNNALLDINHDLTTHVWNLKHHDVSCDFLLRTVQIPSVSIHEYRLSHYLKHELLQRSFRASVDKAGNVVARIGKGGKRLLMLGHIDTVPGDIKPTMVNGKLIARGSVDAKGAFAAFVIAAEAFRDSEDIDISVIGSVEEEVASSKGGIYVRDNYEADAVIIGEPSNTYNIVLGYNGMIKLEIKASVQLTHSAAKGYESASDRVMVATRDLVEKIRNAGVNNISLREIHSWYENEFEYATAMINFRFPPKCSLDQLKDIIHGYQAHNDKLQIKIFREDPGVMFSRTNNVAKAFYRAIRDIGKQPKFLFKTGTSYMNTLAKKWKCPMIAYGPGDSALDHTSNEHLFMTELEKACEILKKAVQNWIEYEKRGKQ